MAGIRALLGIFPKTGDYESKRNQLESEYKSLLTFKGSKELRRYHELEEYMQSEEFAKKKKEIIDLRFKQTEDYQKEKEFFALKKSADIKLYYKIKNSEELKTFQTFDKSSELKDYLKLEEFINSEEFDAVKRESGLSARQKFANSDLNKTLEQYENLKNDKRIKSYFQFINHKAYSNFESFKMSDKLGQFKQLEKEVNSSAFLDKITSMKKADFKVSAEKRKLDEYKVIKKSKEYKDYLKLSHSSLKQYYDDLHNSDELEVFTDLKSFIGSEDFKRQRREIETKSFKDTPEFNQLQKYQSLSKSDNIRFYYKFKNSKGYKNYLNLMNSDRITNFELMKDYIESDEFQRFKAYCLKAPKKRWTESKEYEILQEFETLKKTEKIVWYFKNIDSKKFSWYRQWEETFHEDFSSAKLDSKKWITKYYWGDKMLKDSYSLSHDKHFVTDGENLNIDNGKMHIVTRKETVKGKSWHPTMGFITREFNYTSGLISTGKSFRQKYGTFEAKIKLHEAKSIQNAFWMVGKTMLPHIDIAKAGKKLYVGNAWGNSRDLKTVQRFKNSLSRNRFAKDYFIYSLEWLPNRIVWKINGVVIASTNKGIPGESMYLVLSSGLHKDVGSLLPASFEIDWVRCYQTNKQV